MAQAKYTRIDNRRQSSSYCSNVTIVAFVALCLVGVWMMTSSSVVPSQNADENKDEVKQQVIENSTKQLEDSQGDNPEDARKDSESTVKHGENDPGAEGNEEVNLQEKPEEEKPEEKSEAEKPEERSEEKHEEEKPEEKSEEKHEDEKPEERSEEKHEDEKPEEKSEEKHEDEKPEEKSEEKHEDEKPEEKSEEKHEDEKPEEKSEDKSEEEKPEEKSGDKTADTHDEVKPEEKAEEKIEGKSDEDNNSDDRTKSQTQPNDESGSEMQGGSNSEGGSTKSDGEGYPDENGNKPDPDLVDKKDPSDDTTKKPDGDFTETKDVETGGSEAGDEGDKTDTTGFESSSDGTNNQGSSEVFPSAAQADLLNETVAQGGSFSTQAAESKNEKETQLSSNDQHEYNWKLCNSTAGPDYIPCLDNLQAIKSLKTTKHYEHRERHCPKSPPTCLVPLPEGYKTPIDWPKSRDKIWYYNVPHTKLAQVKGHQNWVKVTGEYLTFPGGGTQFTHGALHYIDFINESVPDVAWGKRTRVILDVGCGVASFGGYLFDRDVLTMSFAPKDEHEAQVQFALERGIPAISAVMGTKRLPFPGIVFDAVHCARCRVPWHIEGGKLLLELNRVLRPGGFFLWSATPVYQKLAEDVEIWNAMTELTKAMCWDLVSINKDTINGVGVATFRKPSTNECYDKRSLQKPPMCEASDDRNAAWNVPLQSCMHNVPVDSLKRGSQWPEQWPVRLEKSPYWMLSSQVGVYGKPEPEDFTADYEHWKRVVSKSYLKGLGINWATVRNVMDMRSIYGGFAAALKDINVWVMNVVPIDSPDTLPIIYERGLFGIYHDWCESFNTYPRTYDLLHADHLFSKIKKRCNLVAVVAEVDRILRPEGKLIVRDNVETMGELENLLKSMKWEVRMTYSKDNEGLLCVQKSVWRPTESETITYAIA